MEGSPLWQWCPAEGLDSKAGLPLGRQGTGMAMVGERLFLFGGRVEGKERVYSNDMWARAAGEGHCWVELSAGKKPEPWPCARHNHALVAVGERLFLHGGSRHGALKQGRYEQLYLNDLWVFEEASAWRVLCEDGPKRHCHALLPTDNGLVLFGGFGDGAYHNDVWVCQMEPLEWRQVRATGEAPRPRSQMGACVSGGRLWVFGGYHWTQAKGEVYHNDLFSLSLADFMWTRHELPGAPSARNRVSMAEVAPLRMIVVNGNYYQNKRGTDEWYAEVFELDVSGQPSWRRVQCEGRAPSQSHMACVVHNGLACFFGGEKSRRRFNTFHILRIA
jgi:hypothetical protein